MTNDLSAGVEPGGRERDSEIEATLDALRKDAEIAHVLLGFASALAEVRTVDATTELTMQLVPKVMGCDRCFIAALNRADGRLYVMNKGGFTDEEARAFESLLHPSGSLPLLRRAIHDQAPLIVEDANNDHRITREEAELRNLGALMRIPLIREGEVYGALALEYRKPRVFDSKEASLARGIGHQLAVALANARQYNLLASLSRFGPRIATRFRLREVSEEVASGAADLLGGEAARLYLIDHARRSLFPAAGSGEAPAGRFDRVDLAQNPWAELLAGGTAMISKEGDPAAVIAAPVMGTDASLVGAVLVFFDHNVAMGEVETEALKVLASLSALALEYRKPRVFDSKEASLARGIGHQLAVALANARQYNLLASLSRFGPRIATRFRLQEVSEEVASGAADLLGGDAARLYLIDQARRSLFPAAGSGEAPAGRFDRIDLAQNPWAELLAGRTAMISKEGDPAAVIAAPVMGTASLLGAVLVFFDRNVAMGEVETEALKVLASLSALALQNAQRFERQRRVARSLQQGLLSTETPALIGSQVAAVYEPASSESDVGGDFYDVFEVRKGVYGLVVGDVAGKGAEAAALTAQAKYMLRAFASRNRSPASVLFHLNNALSASLDVDRFATLVYVVYDTDRQRCVMSSAGHPAALLFRADDGSVEALELSGMVLGAFANQQFEQTEIDLRPGDVLLAHTDGLTEARSDTGEMFERERVERLLADLAPRTEPAELARAIYGEAKAFGRVTDDTVVFTLACPRT